MRVLKSDGAIFYNHKWRVQRGLLQDRSEIVDGFSVRQIIIWNRSGEINGIVKSTAMQNGLRPDGSQIRLTSIDHVNGTQCGTQPHRCQE